MPTSFWLISRLKTAERSRCLMEAARTKSMASVLLPMAPGRDDDHLAGQEPVGEAVQVGEAGRDALLLAVPFDGLDFVDDLLEHRVHRGVAGTVGGGLGDVCERGRGVVQDPVGVALAGGCHLRDLQTSLLEAAQLGAVENDLCVVDREGGARAGLDELGEVDLAADTGQVAALGQLVQLA
ncbi:hypothetical protein [Streptomyces sp. NBC_01455]|uniref:hypothetical protein n=1 Tax=Streptomyces sp. NBC_01455 TaxID=2903874 RepID=UPI002E3047BB|nr:hypothetical protein [Streptomyces sp. NBC_01455]